MSVDSAYRPGKSRKRLIRPRQVGYFQPMPEKGKLTPERREFLARNREMLMGGEPAAGRGEKQVYVEAVQELAAQGVTDPVKRQQYAALETRMELAAQLLACGATYEETGDWVGVKASTVAGYYADPHVRARVDEYKSMLKEVIGGRILGSLDRLTGDPEKLDALGVRDKMALYDRFESRPAGPAAGAANVNVNVGVLSYGELMERATRTAGPVQAALGVDDAGAQGSDFPLIEREAPRRVSSPAVAGGGASGD